MLLERAHSHLPEVDNMLTKQRAGAFYFHFDNVSRPVFQRHGLSIIHFGHSVTQSWMTVGKR